MSRSVFALLASHAQLRETITALDQSGFRKDDISVLYPDQQSSHGLSHERNSKAPEGAVVGGLTGAGVGGMVGLLAGIGALAIPGVGPLIAAGPILAALSGAAIGAAAGSLTGSLIGMGIPEFEAKRYESRLREGGILISVHVEDKEAIDRAKDILTEEGATDISVTREGSANAENKRRESKMQKASKIDLDDDQHSDGSDRQPVSSSTEPR